MVTEVQQVNGIRCWKFSNTDSEPDMDITWERIKEKYNNGCSFGIDHLKEEGIFRLMGWCYDFRDRMKTYLVKQYGTWTEVWAPNKTLLRKSTYGRIDRIVELK